MQEIPENVKNFINLCSNLVTNYEQELFLSDVHYSIAKSDSPIEQLFGSAVHTVLKITGHSVIMYRDHEGYKYDGILVQEQVQFERYRADYVLSQGENLSNAIIVELDGHNFHDRSEPQRRSEKRRDRFFQKKGFRVFRFTGSEIVTDPFKAAVECVAFLINYDEESIYETLAQYGYKR